MAANIQFEKDEFDDPPAKFRSAVWKHFKFPVYYENGVRKVSREKTCKASIAYNGNTTNMSTHVSRHHPSISVDDEDGSKKRKGGTSEVHISKKQKKSGSMTQLKLSEAYGQKLASCSDRYKLITKSIGRFIAHDLRPYSVVDSSFHEDEIELQCRLTNENCVKAVVVTASMSGDLEVLVDAKYEVDGNIDIEEEILKVLKLFCAYLIREHVGIVFCQKVIHPCLKLQLRGAGIIVLDRLGLQPANLTMEITGAVAVQSFVTPVPSVCFGKLATIRHIILKGKSYLLLTAEGKTVCTLLLCGRHEEAVQELKDVCSTALALLERLLHEHEPSVLMGAGCWQIHMASTLRKQVMSSREQLSETFGCTLSDVISACRTFSHCLELVGLSVSHDEEEHLIDNKYLHLWRVPKGEGDSLMEGTGGPQTCSCGLVKWNSKLKFYQILGNDSCVSECIGDDSSSGSFQEPSNWESLVVDSESVSINALKTAVLTACTVLQIRQYIENVN
ncbi:hypothetical protein ScPMuIL_014856 [Solemya velum]